VHELIVIETGHIDARFKREVWDQEFVPKRR